MPLWPSTRTSRASAAVAATTAILPAFPDAACWHTHSANVRVFPKPRPASSSQTCQSPGGGNWFGREIAGQEASSASASCAAKESAILGSLNATGPAISPTSRFEHFKVPKWLRLLRPTPKGRHYSGIGGTGPAVILGGGWAGSSSLSFFSNRLSSGSGSV